MNKRMTEIKANQTIILIAERNNSKNIFTNFEKNAKNNKNYSVNARKIEENITINHASLTWIISGNTE